MEDIINRKAVKIMSEDNKETTCGNCDNCTCGNKTPIKESSECNGCDDSDCDKRK